MSPAVIKRTHTADELQRKRHRLLSSIGLNNARDREELAETRMLTDAEEAVAYELENIAFLLGEDPVRIS